MAAVSDPGDSGAGTIDKSATDAVTNIDNAVPGLSSVSPSLGLIAGATSDQQITINGTGFNASTTVNFGGNVLSGGTATAAGTSLTITIPHADLATAGNVTVSVNNPKNPTTSNGGGTSIAGQNQTFPVVGMQSLAPQTGTANPAPVVAGTPFALQMNLNLTPTGATLPANVTITCSLPMALTSATCSPSPATIMSGTATPTTVITINAVPTKETSGSSASPSGFGGQGPRSNYMLWLVAAVLLSMLGMFGAVRQRTLPLRRAPVYLGLVLLVLAAGALVGCTTAKSGPTPTPTGPSTVTVTATTADGATVSATVNITVSN
jgi:hypothetical protein